MKLAELEAKVNKLEAEVQATKDIEAIKKLQYAYGYYLEHWEEEHLSGCFPTTPKSPSRSTISACLEAGKVLKNVISLKTTTPTIPD